MTTIAARAYQCARCARVRIVAVPSSYVIGSMPDAMARSMWSPEVGWARDVNGNWLCRRCLASLPGVRARLEVERSHMTTIQRAGL